MMQLHARYPMYHWDDNKGYPTRSHRQAIAEYGPSPFHRMSFRLLDTQLTLDL
jgi:ribonuclease HII